MAKQLTQYQMARLARKSSDITRLSSQYRNSVNDLSNQYQSSFADYQKKRDEIMAPYEAASAQYKTDFSTYETNLAGYKDKLTAYTAQLEDIQKNPTVQVGTSTGKSKFGDTYVIDGTTYYGTRNLPDGYTGENGVLYKRRDAGTFDDKAPTAPDAPKMPTVDAFDSTQFDTKRAELDSGYKREVGERKASRASAVSRKAARPLLQGA